MLDVNKTQSYRKVKEFQCLRVLPDTKNDESFEIGTRIVKAERAFFALLKIFQSKLVIEVNRSKIVHDSNKVEIGIRL